MYKPKRIVIVGGGTAGWMVAAGLKQHFAQLADITLVESSDIGTIGVGEATIPTIRNFYQQLGMRDLDVLRETRATCKLGIEFRDWHKPESNFIHPFGLYGQALGGIDFHHFWLKMKRKNLAAELGDYSLGVTLARQHKFTLPAKNPPSTLSVFDWALHLDASLFAQLMRDYATQHGVTRIDATVEQVDLCPSSGNIQSVNTNSGHRIEGDLFIDCSGFRALLIGGALGIEYEHWDQWLLCDRALAVQSESTQPPAPYTRVTAQSAGWQWKIPLQHRNGNGHVYSSRFISDAQAQETLETSIHERLLHKPRQLRFCPGRRQQSWHKNCIAIGLSAGFLEPLESTSIALIQTAIEKIKTLATNLDCQPSVVTEFNETTALEYERVRDFLILHYKLNGRCDSEFWHYCRNMPIPDSLQHKIDLFRASGHIVNYRWEMFHQPSWLAIFSGFDYLPDEYDRRVDNFDEQQLDFSLREMRKSLQRVAEESAGHGEFIAQRCTGETAH